MKKITLSLVLLSTISTFSIAGGNIQPVESIVEEVEESPAGNFYVGAGYSHLNMNIEGSQMLNSVFHPPVLGETDITGHSLLLLAGYNFNQFLALEGRYSFSMGNLDVENDAGDSELDADMSNLALYLKPMYPIGSLTLYALLGYGQVTLDDGTEYSENGFQWGVGATYDVYENIGLFIDYTRLYDDKGFDNTWIDQDVVVDAINIGVTYKF
ncbi:porin family protein [Sulfurovum sp. zt1-1]|uniref:Porin family protein n=1 Tax=Sulfurovum zhangzhouensis TaxID=3019067 RepID=A0ABT7QZC8_9BACT|nr:porin family protein [Sulfurovum zhangzhouensis]MDM5271596.1 porin family protein [Sulfurovum zhangzhouensis]